MVAVARAVEAFQVEPSALAGQTVVVARAAEAFQAAPLVEAYQVGQQMDRSQHPTEPSVAQMDRCPSMERVVAAMLDWVPSVVAAEVAEAIADWAPLELEPAAD